MTVAATPALAAAQFTTARFRAVAEVANLSDFPETLAPEVVLRSPINLQAHFQGRKAIAELMPACSKS